MKMHMGIQAGTKPVDKLDRAQVQVQVGRVYLCSTTRRKMRRAALSAPLARCK